jgi:hypothetical protein
MYLLSKINVLEIKINFVFLSARLSFSRLAGGRKVRTAQGNTPVNRRSRFIGKKVPQKITVTLRRDEGENVR